MRKHLTLVQEDDEQTFKRRVEEVLNSRRVLSLKFQRNLYYSLSGSTGTDKVALEDKSALKQNFLAFIVWEEET